MKKLILLTIINLIIFVTLVNASYMDTGFIEWQQPNGATFIARTWGDEFENRMETENGYRICKAIDGYYYYAVLDEFGEYKPSDNKVSIDQPLAESLQLERSVERKAEIYAEIDTF